MAVCKLVLLEKEFICHDIVSMWLDASDVKEPVRAGQFFNIDCGGDTYLRRPISVCDFEDGSSDNGSSDSGSGDGKMQRRIRIVFQVKGRGTTLLADSAVGSEISALGPLGNGFDISDDVKSCVVIGGGVGICPLLYLTKTLAARNIKVSVFLGYRNKDNTFLIEDMTNIQGADVTFSTDDGTLGYHGNSLEALKASARLDSKPDMIYTCGPQIMMDNVIAEADKRGLLYQESREERMGCGIGACLVCACKMQDGAMGHVCKDGPVFGTGVRGGRVAHHE